MALTYDDIPRSSWIEVDLGALAHNMRELRRVTRPSAKIMAVLKADAYGHGAVRMAEAVLAAGADRIGVSTLAEALELRQAGVTAPIMILSGLFDEQVDLALMHGVIQTVSSLAEARFISARAQALGVQAVLHVKIDTGMSRIGFAPNAESVEEIAAMRSLPCLRLEGIFTHFATADAEDKTETRRQFACFMDMLAALSARGLDFAVRHAANSAAILELPEMHLDMVRAGILLYGLYPSGKPIPGGPELRPVMQVKARVTQLKTVPAGTGVGYGHVFVSSRPTQIATVPVGYADGYLRCNRGGRVLLHGQSVPVIGNVCMDQMMLDVTDCPVAAVGDEVVLMGVQKDACIPAEELAERAASINYEIVCNFKKRLPRRYVNS